MILHTTARLPVKLIGPHKEKPMYTVEYSYYSYPRLSKSFETYQAAKGFFNRVRRSSGVRVAELICPVTNEDIILDKSKPAYMVERSL